MISEVIHAQVSYHGSMPAKHGRWWVADVCVCSETCRRAARVGDEQAARYVLINQPFRMIATATLSHVRRGSFTVDAPPG